MVTAGGAMVGYCAIGRVKIASPPANMMTMAITQAKIGRSMKKRDMAGRPSGSPGPKTGQAAAVAASLTERASPVRRA